MLATPSADLSSTALGFKAFLENSYDNRNVVHVTAGSFVPLKGDILAKSKVAVNKIGK